MMLGLNLLLIFLLPVVVYGEEALSSKQCEELGFTGLALCSDCSTLAEYVKDQELVSECRKCCVEDSDDAAEKVNYSGAILEICRRKLMFYPEIFNFIEEEKHKFPNVKVQFVFNSPPKFILLDGEGNQKETLRIDNWKNEHILRFLEEKVGRGSSAI